VTKIGCIIHDISPRTAFDNVTSLTLPNTLITLADIPNLNVTHLTIPASVETIRSCTKQSNDINFRCSPEGFMSSMSIISSKQPWSLVFADGSPITTLSMGSFGYANIASVVLPSGLHAIENGVFAGNHLQSAAIPSLQTPSPATQTFVLAGGLTTITFVCTYRRN
jgi:hypothetical protein